MGVGSGALGHLHGQAAGFPGGLAGCGCCAGNVDPDARVDVGYRSRWSGEVLVPCRYRSLGRGERRRELGLGVVPVLAGARPGSQRRADLLLAGLDHGHTRCAARPGLGPVVAGEHASRDRLDTDLRHVRSGLGEPGHGEPRHVRRHTVHDGRRRPGRPVVLVQHQGARPGWPDRQVLQLQWRFPAALVHVRGACDRANGLDALVQLGTQSAGRGGVGDEFHGPLGRFLHSSGYGLLHRVRCGRREQGLVEQRRGREPLGPDPVLEHVRRPVLGQQRLGSSQRGTAGACGRAVLRQCRWHDQRLLQGP